MARTLKLQNLQFQVATYEGASAYSFADSHPLIHLTFSMGSALFHDGFYETEIQQVRNYAKALVDAWKVDPKFAWQFAAWMRDPKLGKGNRIQGSLAPALLDALLGETEFTEPYVAKCLSHRPDDVTAFLRHFEQLGLRTPSAAARRGMAKALAGFDEYQLMKYQEAKASDVRLCDAILFVREELDALGDAGRLAVHVGRYLHASSRHRNELAQSLPLTSVRRELWKQPKAFAVDAAFDGAVKDARVTWEQVLSHFGVADDVGEGKRVNRAVWDAMLGVRGLLGDMAFMRNMRNMSQAGFSERELRKLASKRRFTEVWPHQIYAGYRAVPELLSVWDVVFANVVEKLPAGRHLGIADASGSMGTRVGGAQGSLTCADVATCFVSLMSETSGLGASFADDQWLSYGSTKNYLSLAERKRNESALAFSSRPELQRGWGGTQVFGAVMELITWLKQHKRVEPPDCLWFFSDMQFHPAEGALKSVPSELAKDAARLGLGKNVPPLELALQLYRKLIGPVDVVLWNLAAYAPVPVPADMEGVLLVSGFDANTFKNVAAWRAGSTRKDKVEENQEVILDRIREF